VREMREELGVDVVIRPIGDEPVWGTTDDDVKGTLWRCSFFVVEKASPDQEVKVSASLLQFASTIPVSCLSILHFLESDASQRRCKWKC
jgi:hypothetical protein